MKIITGISVWGVGVVGGRDCLAQTLAIIRTIINFTERLVSLPCYVTEETTPQTLNFFSRYGGTLHTLHITVFLILPIHTIHIVPASPFQTNYLCP